MKRQTGKVLRNYRLSTGMTQGDIAKKLGQKGWHGFVSRIETGKVSPSLDELLKILEIYNIDEETFLLDLLKEYKQTRPKS